MTFMNGINTAQAWHSEIGNSWLHRFAVLTAAVTVALIAAGATVTSTGSGDAVPDWPLAYGSVLPRMVGGVLIEHTHRLVAGVTGLLIAALAIWLWAREPRRWVRWLGGGALLAVLAQALLGGLRVLVVSDPPLQDAVLRATGVAHVDPVRIGIAVVHASLAQIVLCLTFALATVTSQAWPRHEQSRDAGARMGRWLSIGLVLVIFVQLLLGALMRHTGAGLAIPDFPLSFGHLVPPFANLPYNTNAPMPVAPETLKLQVLVHFLHRLGALTVACFVLLWAGYVFKRYNKLRGSAWLLLALTAAQISLGASIIWTRKSVPITIAHVATGALLLGGSVVLALWTWRLMPESKAASFGLPMRHVEVSQR
jgi:cytochrome c oxidase assembly protein subunit 15